MTELSSQQITQGKKNDASINCISHLLYIGY